MESFARRLAMLAVLGSMLSGCAFNKLRLDGKFAGLKDGLQQAAASNAVMRMLVVHGIGDHSPGYSDKFVSPLARELDFERTDTEEIRLTRNSRTNGILTRVSFGAADGQTRLLVYELTWAPTTRDVKQEAFKLDAELEKRRSRLNRTLKKKLFNDGFGDAVLYLGTDFGTRMRHTITNALHIILEENDFSTNDTIVIVTHSLGSKMTFDSIVDMAKQDAQTETGRRKAQDLAIQTRHLIMFANQIPLLRLAESTEATVATSAVAETNISTQFPAVQQFIEIRDKAAKEKSRSEPDLHIIAVSDPNDVLSYPLRRKDVVSDSFDQIAFGHVHISNAGSFFKLFANPIRAHSGYFENRRLRRLLIDGYEANVQKPL